MIWTNEDVQFLRDNAETLPVSEIADELERSEDAIRVKAHRLGVSLGAGPIGRPWTDEERTQARILRFRGFSWSEIGKALGRSRHSVRGALLR